MWSRICEVLNKVKGINCVRVGIEKIRKVEKIGFILCDEISEAKVIK